MTCADPLCLARLQQLERLERENLELRLEVANGSATVSARQDLERVNARLVAANEKISQLEARLHKRKKATT